jgi:hypothetical protein
MPFDGSSNSPELRLLSGLLEFFEQDDPWVQEMFSDGEGRSCLVDALRLTRQRLGIKHDRTRAYLTRAIRQHHRNGRLQEFNDYLCSGIEELRDTIRFAYALAAVYPPAVYRMRQERQPATRSRANLPSTALHTWNVAHP